MNDAPAPTESRRAIRLEIRERLLARNVLLNLIGQGLPLAVAVATVPTVVRGLGTDRFGILALAWVALSSFSVFDLGLGRATTKFVADALGKGNHERVPAIVWTAATVQAAFGILGGAVLVASTPVLVDRVLNIPSHLTDEARLSLYLLALSVPFVVISGSFRGVLEATQRFDLVNTVRVSLGAFNFLLPFVGALSGWGLTEIVASLAASWGLASLLQFLFCARVVPSLWTPFRLDLNELRSLAAYSAWVSVSSVVGPVLVYFDRFMIGAALSMTAVAHYSAPYEMITRLLVVSASLVSTLFPALSVMSDQGQQRRIDALVSRSARYLLLGVGPVVCLAVVYSDQIMGTWLGPDFVGESATAFRILAVGVLMNSLAAVPYSLIQALGRPDVTARIHLLELPVHIALVWGLVKIWGIPGAATAWSVRATMDAALLFIAASSLGGMPLSTLFTNRNLRTLLLLFALAIAATGIKAAAVVMWLDLTIWMSVLVGMSLAVWHFVLDEGERDEILGVIWASGRKWKQSA